MKFAVALFTVLLPALTQAATCTFSVGTLSFGAYVGSQIAVSIPVSLNCVKPPGPPEEFDYFVSLSPGSGIYLQRRMNRTALPADTLNYNLYLNTLPPVLNTNVWGDGSGSTIRWTGYLRLTGNANVTLNATLVGAVPAGAFPAAGTYQDSIVATVLLIYL